MKIAIHERKGSFSDSWIKYCQKSKIPFKIVDCYSTDIINHLRDCDVLMWHHHHHNYKDLLFAKQLLFSLEQSGVKVFPNFNTNWHFDDKIGQKYLLESINAPLVPSYVFYDKKSALNWAKKTDFPKVFKLRGGAGSSNVRLIKSHAQCIRLINKAFGKGFSRYNSFHYMRERTRRFKKSKNLYEILKGFGRLFFKPVFARMTMREKGYVYMQDFIPENDCDYRVVVVNGKAIAIKRMVRENDFRASGSGHIFYDKDNFEDNLIKTAFQVVKKLNIQCCAFDFVYDKCSNPLIVEISYGFTSSGYIPCVGYWNEDMKFYKSEIDIETWVLEQVISSIKS